MNANQSIYWVMLIIAIIFAVFGIDLIMDVFSILTIIYFMPMALKNDESNEWF